MSAWVLWLQHHSFSNRRRLCGLPEAAPFDAIMLTAAPPELPAPLLEQSAGGVLIAPVGRDAQELIVVTRTEEGLSSFSPGGPFCP